jgi:iron complex outermembrane receptor protein
MKKLLLLLSSLLLLSEAYCQVIKGTITDKLNGEPLIGATVLIKGTTNGASADLNGFFSINTEIPLPLTLVCSYVGYVTQELLIKNSDDKISFRMTANQTSLKEINITDQRITEKQKESPLTVEAMDIIAIRETPAADFYEGLGQLKGVDLTSASIGFKVINTRGFNSTSPVRSLQIIDGVDNQSPGLNFSLGNFLGCSEMDVLKVDLIAGASSAFYGPNAFNGVISMTTRSPFVKPGFEISTKTGTRNLLETCMRYAFVVKDKNKVDRFGMKFNAFFMKARDWEANNFSPTPQSRNDESNPGGYDAVNIYGDEYNAIYDATGTVISRPGLGVYYRKGYKESDLVDYNTQNIKLNAAAHYKIGKERELIYSSNFGYGTTVYQGDNRYSLKNIEFYQNRIEFRKQDKFFIRIYETHEDAGDSYDAYFTALLMQRASKSDDKWNREYQTYFDTAMVKQVKALTGYPAPYVGFGQSYIDSLKLFLLANGTSLTDFHELTSAYVNGTTTINGAAFYEPGTPRFDSLFHKITTGESFSKGGSKFFDRSALYHAHGEYKFKIKFRPENMDITVGSSYRLYKPDSHGTIFSDTGNVKITNSEWGAYLGVEQKIPFTSLKLNAVARVDKNENFNMLFSPAISAIYKFNEDHLVRITFTSAIRNPTLTDQYLYYPVGRAFLLGNISGYDSLVTLSSFTDALNLNDPAAMKYFNVAPVRPEKVKTIEAGYRATFFKRLYIDASYYYSSYDDFIGYQLGAVIPLIFIKSNIPPFPVQDTTFDFNNIKVYRVASNATDKVTTQGVSVGANYFFGKFFSVNANYSFNQLNKEPTDPLIPAFNTPENKYNIGIAGRDILTDKIKNWGFNINYKWVEGFLFEGSPQFTGEIDTYDLVDAQVNKTFPEQHTTFKFGIQNLLNNKHYEVYGGPLVGRLAYFQINVALN